MIRSFLRDCALALLLSALLSSCSGGRDDALNTQNIGRSDSAIEEGEGGASAEDDGEDEADAGEEEGEGEDAEDAGDFDAIVSVEVADAGEAPDTTVVTEVALCGNGTLDGEEQCDQGDDNSDTQPGACRSNCRSARCGDGVIDEGETCDQGASNSDSTADACRSTCSAARCGDNVVDRGEQCDSGDARSDTAAGACRLDCRSARCGDGVLDNDEGCDDGNTVDDDACRNSCLSARCGDGVRDPEEECDDGNNASGDGCQATCRAPRCGDGVMDAAEQCDDGNTVENDGCRSNCQNGCVEDAACSDGLFCNGSERCLNGLCNPGAGVDLDDGVPCTEDACSEELDRVTHTPVDARCDPPGPTCSSARGTSRTASCDATRGCLVHETSVDCDDPPSACQLRGDGSYTLLTYTPACEDAMSCGAADESSRLCAHVPASCTDRVFTGRADATCDPNAESCGNATPAMDDCRTRDSASCSAGNRSFTRVTGTCSTTGGCGSTTTGPIDCEDPPDTCSAAVRTSYEPTCSASGGCGTPAATSTRCTQASAPSCGDFGPRGQAALRTFTPACDDARPGECSTTGAIATTSVCTPRVASTCDNTATRIPRETLYGPACESASSCSADGAPTVRNCTASSTRTCDNTGPNGQPQITSFVPDCENGARCLAGGRQVRTDCTATAGVTCQFRNDRATLVSFQPACDEANPSQCFPGGTELNEFCTQRPIACSGNTAVTSINQCLTAACATVSTTCTTGRSMVCTSSGGVQLREGTGTCTPGTGCGFIVRQETPCPASCGPNAAGQLMVCPGGCTTGTSGQASCRACTPCNGRCQNGACIAGVGTVGSIGTVGTVGSVVDPSLLRFE